MSAQTREARTFGGRYLSRFVSVTVSALLAVAVFLTVYATVCRVKGKTAFVFGYAMLYVQTESMEPTITRQSCILVRRADTNTIREGDVITYVCRDPSSAVYGAQITHRVTEVTEEGFRTKGDHPLAVTDKMTVAPEDVVAVYVKNLFFMTFLSRAFSGAFGLIFIVSVFALSVGVFFIRDVVKTLAEVDEEQRRDEKEKEIRRRIDEEVRRRMEEEDEKTEK